VEREDVRPDGRAAFKVCHLSTVHQLLDARVFYKECTPLAKAGYDVRLICPCGRDGVIDQVKVIPSHRWNRRIPRILFSPLILIPALKQKADIYHLHAVELIPSGLVLKLILGKKVVCDVHEDYPAMMLEKKWIPRPLRKVVSGAVEQAESISARVLDGVVTADPFVLERFDHVPDRRKIVFYNYPPLDQFAQTVARGLSKPYDVVCVGGMSERSGVFVLLKAIQSLAHSGMRLKALLAGYFDDEASKEKLQADVRELRLTEQVHVSDRIPHSDVPRVMSQGRVGVVALQPIPKFLKNIPTKLFEYWACGLPAVASDLPPVRLFFKDGEYGLLVNPTEPEAFASAIRWLLTHPEEAVAMGEKAQRAVFEGWNSEAQLGKLTHFYDQVLNGGGRS
jgi:glycosyltransferase involved in cell wall biosynthesis